MRSTSCARAVTTLRCVVVSIGPAPVSLRQLIWLWKSFTFVYILQMVLFAFLGHIASAKHLYKANQTYSGTRRSSCVKCLPQRWPGRQYKNHSFDTKYIEKTERMQDAKSQYQRGICGLKNMFNSRSPNRGGQKIHYGQEYFEINIVVVKPYPQILMRTKQVFHSWHDWIYEQIFLTFFSNWIWLHL